MSNTESDQIVLETAITSPPVGSTEEQISQEAGETAEEAGVEAPEVEAPEAEPEPEIVSDEILKWREYIESTKGPEGEELTYFFPIGKEAFSDCTFFVLICFPNSRAPMVFFMVTKV